MKAPDLDDVRADAIALFIAVMTGDTEGTRAIVAAQPAGNSGWLLDALCAWFATILGQVDEDPLELAQKQLQALTGPS